MSRFEIGENYHVYNRGVEKRKIFLDEEDYERFFFILDIFNDKNSTINTARRINISEGSRTSLRPKKKERIVDIIEYCFMPNHFHILAAPLVDGGLSKLMQRIGVGYTHYFNKKYKRSGVLFQGGSKSKHIDSNEYLLWIKQYIHLNPVELFFTSSNQNINDIVSTLNDYKWVSCDNYNIYKPEIDEVREVGLPSFEEIDRF